MKRGRFYIEYSKDDSFAYLFTCSFLFLCHGLLWQSNFIKDIFEFKPWRTRYCHLSTSVSCVKITQRWLFKLDWNGIGNICINIYRVPKKLSFGLFITKFLNIWRMKLTTSLVGKSELSSDAFLLWYEPRLSLKVLPLTFRQRPFQPCPPQQTGPLTV